MDGSKKQVTTFSDRNPLNGTEVPASKTIKPSQIHHDFQPFRTAATFIVSPTPQPQKLVDFRMSPACSIRSDNIFRPRGQSQQEMPAQLIASSSFAHVPVQMHSFKPNHSDAIRIAREKMNSTIGLKATKGRSVIAAEGRRLLDFEPYTLEDYRKLKPSLGQAMGGLGPYMVGTPEWDAATQKVRRVKDFAETIRRSNTFA